jgi:hypothetical protein
VLPDGNPFFVTPAVIPQPPSRTRCLHNRTFDTYYAGVSWTESDGATRDLDINLRLIASDRPECRNGCGGVPLPAVGDTGPIFDPAARAQYLRQLGGCRGCGDSPVEGY